jgi:hypothetical protein
LLPAFNRPAIPVPTASDIRFVAPVLESATAVAAPVSTPVAMLCRFTAFRTDFAMLLVAFLDFLLIAKSNRISDLPPPCGNENIGDVTQSSHGGG